MNFPFIGIPEIFPGFRDAHLFFGIVLSLGGSICGLFFLLLNAFSDGSQEKNKDFARIGYLLIGLGLLGAVFGMYFPFFLIALVLLAVLGELSNWILVSLLWKNMKLAFDVKPILEEELPKEEEFQEEEFEE